MIQEHMSDIYSWYGGWIFPEKEKKQNRGSLGLYCVHSFSHTGGEKMKNLRSFDQRIFPSIFPIFRRIVGSCQSIFIIHRFTWKRVKISAAQVAECKWKIAEIFFAMPERNIPLLFAFYRDFSAMSFLFKTWWCQRQSCMPETKLISVGERWN